MHTKNQEAGSILNALSKRPHFHRTYLVTVRKRMSIAVSKSHFFKITEGFEVDGQSTAQVHGNTGDGRPL